MQAIGLDRGQAEVVAGRGYPGVTQIERELKRWICRHCVIPLNIHALLFHNPLHYK
jgi:hypothetical protein